MKDGDSAGMPGKVILDLVKSSIAKAEKSHLAYVEMSEKMIFQTGGGLVAESDRLFNQKALDLARSDAEQHFRLAVALMDAKDEEEALRLRDAHSRIQSREMARRVAELQEMVRKKAENPSAAVATPDEPEEAAPVAEKPSQEEDGPDAVGEASAAEGEGSSADISSPIASSVGAAALAAVSDAASSGATSSDSSDGGSGDEVSDEDIVANPVQEAEGEGDGPVTDEEMEDRIKALAAKIHSVKSRRVNSGTDREDIVLDVPDDSGITAVAPPPSPAPEEAGTAAVEGQPDREEQAGEAVAEEDVTAGDMIAKEGDMPAETVPEAPAVTEAVMEEAPAPLMPEEVPATAAKEAPAEETVEMPVAAEETQLETTADRTDLSDPETSEIVETAPAKSGQALDEEEEFDRDLAARLEAVRALLEGSS